MRSFIHKSLGWSATAAGTVAGAAVTFGGEDVRLKIADAASAIYADSGSRTAVIMVAFLWLLAWFVTKANVWEWLMRFKRLPPTVYLSNTEIWGPQGDKTFGLLWRLKDLRLEFRGDGNAPLPDKPTKEDRLSFRLFNAGDADIRHVKVRWQLPGMDLAARIRSSGILGEALKGMERRAIKLAFGDGESTGRGSIIPFSQDITGDVIPRVKAGDKITITAPLAFTVAYTLAGLIKAKAHHDQTYPPGSMPTDALTALDNWTTHGEVAVIELSYIKEERRCRHSFSVCGRLYGGSQPYVPAPTEDCPSLYAQTEGVVAVMDYVEVTPNEQ